MKDGEKLSIAIISKYPIVTSKFNLLPNPNLKFMWKGQMVSSHDKGLLESVINYQGLNIRIVSGHMVPFRKYEKNFMDKEFSNIRDEIEKIVLSKQMPQAICADMNYNEDIKALLPNVFANGLSSTLKDVPTTPKGRKYDKIIISKEWQLIESNIIKGKADHYLCFAELK